MFDGENIFSPLFTLLHFLLSKYYINRTDWRMYCLLHGTNMSEVLGGNTSN